MGIIEVIQVVFIVLKLCNVIDWSWWVVLIPLYIDILLYGSIVLLHIIVNSMEKKMISDFAKEHKRRIKKGYELDNLE